jgi:hypothetical protein
MHGARNSTRSHSIMPSRSVGVVMHRCGCGLMTIGILIIGSPPHWEDEGSKSKSRWCYT